LKGKRKGLRYSNDGLKKNTYSNLEMANNMIEEFYYRCRQLFQEILSPQGFTEQEEKIALGFSTGFTKGDLEIVWLYDQRDQMLMPGLKEGTKNLRKAYF
jgi:hypothetical protein